MELIVVMAVIAINNINKDRRRRRLFGKLGSRGFTLLELIVVMAVLSILVAMGVPRFIGYTKDADVTAMKVDAGMLEQVSLQHMLVNGDAWPVGAECSSIDPEVLAIVENVLRRRGSLASVSELAAAGAFCELDEAALSLYVRSTANSLSDYFIVNRVDGVDGYANELEGFVFSKEVFEDRSGVKWSGLYCEEEDEDNLAIKQVVGGGRDFSLALKSDGTVWAWGNNYYGQLGNGTTVKSAVPVKVKNLSNIIAIAAGYDHCLALSRNGTVWAWGGNSRGQLGNGLFEDDYYYGSTVPVQVLGPGGDGYLSGVKAIAAGYRYSMALMDDGTVWAWGDNRFGSLGIGKGYRDYGLSSPDNGPAVEALPVQVVGPGGEGYLTGVAAIASSAHGTSSSGGSSFARLNDGSVWAWGFNGFGKLGIDKDMRDYEGWPYEVCPVRVLGPDGAGCLSGVKSIAPGYAHVLALLNDGSVLAWGGNWFGQLGNGNGVVNSPVPIYVKGPGGEGNLTDVAAIVSGDNFALALKNDGTVWAWGVNGFGQLGNGDYDCEYFPAQVKGADGVGFLTGVKLISAGGYHSLAVKNDGTLWAWGYNEYGQLGTGSYDNELFPFRLSNF